MKRCARYIYPIILLLISLGIYFPYYHLPQALFWDENYHIASAQKYIDGIMFMESHPPLGKMLMAVGEVLLDGNAAVDKSNLLETDHLTGDTVPKTMTFKGFRLPSVAMMAFSVLFFYGIINRITQRAWLAAAFTGLVIFDNALVVHCRAAMLEGIQLFFILGALYYFVRAATDHVQKKHVIALQHYACLGALIGLAISVKMNASVLLLSLVMLFGIDQWDAISTRNWRTVFKRLAQSVPSGLLPVVAIFLAMFYLHIGLGAHVIQERIYKASPEYLTQIRMGRTWSWTAFYHGLKDNLKFMSEHADGVPRLDVCKSNENGSYAMGWPMGHKAIVYRWDRSMANGKTVIHYKYLIGNPIVWLSVLCGIILSVGLIISRYVYGNPVKDEELFYWICAFTGLYLSYMVAILQIERVMYLYHYLVPLLFGALNLALVFNYIYRDEVLANNKHTVINVCLFALLVAAVFAFFAPLTYGFGLTEAQFEMRNWFGFWKLQAVR